MVTFDTIKIPSKCLMKYRLGGHSPIVMQKGSSLLKVFYKTDGEYGNYLIIVQMGGEMRHLIDIFRIKH